MSKFVRRGVNFNVENEHQWKLVEWVTRKSPRNFSGFVKSVLYAAMITEEAALEQKRKTADDSADN
ncbi:hypothetical protein M3G15_08650 [Paenibacillus sp. p3-SID1389]|uniref:hypothetical protein n=1 Tax=Paenibacillus sp. p3-SID1389 TaxID=2916364 RepID=UPI0021A7CBEE|nr:hypothetical protein [Paenibacillus sp. p3-SID1389]MCT2195209.1 hypothetical protein [Paenibacillus sp. p3-SID1389]